MALLDNRDGGAFATSSCRSPGSCFWGVGVGIQVWTASHTASFGWFAYAPLSGTRPTPFTGTEPGPWGAVLTTAGLVILAFWAGLLIGTRRSPAR